MVGGGGELGLARTQSDERGSESHDGAEDVDDMEGHAVNYKLGPTFPHQKLRKLTIGYCEKSKTDHYQTNSEST